MNALHAKAGISSPTGAMHDVFKARERDLEECLRTLAPVADQIGLLVVIDGDGAMLMRLEALATIGHERPHNLTHILLDNGVHDSTGGQRTSAATVSFADVAIGCGYRSAVSCAAPRDFEGALASTGGEDGPHLVHVRIKAGSLEPLGRQEVHPAEVARRFREFVTEAPVAAAAGARA